MSAPRGDGSSFTITPMTKIIQSAQIDLKVEWQKPLMDQNRMKLDTKLKILHGCSTVDHLAYET